MKNNFPVSMMAVAAVVSLGMVGSQLELGGLSGQAAGGDTAGCGGDAYYDEDLGALVDGEGNILDDNGDVGSADAPGEEFFNFEIAIESAGEPMQGQHLVTVIRPNAELADDLQTEEGLIHDARIAISEDGLYAVINFVAPDNPELNEARLLRWSGTEWEMVFQLTAERGEGLELRSPMILHVGLDDPGVGENVVFGLGMTDLLQYRAADGGIRVLTDTTAPAVNEAMNVALEERYGTQDNVELFNRFNELQGVRTFVERGLEHPWLDAFVSANFGPETEWNMHTSLNNRLLVSLSSGEVLAIDGCATGNQPLNAGGELVCTACKDTRAGQCSNVLNRVDALDLSVEAIVTEGEAVFEVAIASNLLRDRPRIALSNLNMHNALNTKSRCVGSDANCEHTYDATVRIYACEGQSSCDGWTGITAANDYAMVKDCTVAVLGSQPSQWRDWIGGNGNLNVGSAGPNGRDHAGFRNGIDNLINAGLSAPCGGNTIWIGHSRGGAMATMLAKELGGSVMSYGAPPAFWHDFSDLNGDRYHASNDPVPDVMYTFGVGGKHNIKNSYERESYCAKRHWWGGCKQTKYRSGRRGVEHNNAWRSLSWGCSVGLLTGGWGCAAAVAHFGYRISNNHVNDYHTINWNR